MNRFRSRKKPHGEVSREGSRRTSFDSDVPALPSFASRTFKRKKNTAPEPKPEIDLSNALPASDDFRTSLLMPKLSARFSMLKEQDDPTSKIGKANDDSVLFPKRASRLDLFNNRPGLSDIAEVDSLRGSIRPPFASLRTESYGSDGYATDDGSVMSRSRPGEGNTMFGGRQKIYKIPVGGAGSVKNFGGQDDNEVSSGANMGGKPIYESDITMSTFQKLREQEKEERERAAHEVCNMRTSREQDRSGSPPYVRYNRNRETTSSTNSAPSQSRASTAATSVASQKSIYGAHENINGLPHGSAQPLQSGSDRPLMKSRRLYGQGLDRDFHEQQASSLQRLGSFNRSRTPVGGPSTNPLHQSRSATNLNDRYQRGGPLYTSNGFRAESPVPSATPPRMAEFDLGLHDDPRSNNINPTDSGYGRSPPLSPPISPDVDSSNPDPTLLASLEPNDIGKATASGAFNKPKKQYDESQYLQRQLQLQEGRNTPSPQPFRPFSPQASSLNEQVTVGRSRDNSLGSNMSRTNSFRYPWMEDRVIRTGSERGASPALRNNSEDNMQPAMERSFFSGVNSGDVSSAPDSESEADSNSPVLSSSKFQGFDRSSPTEPIEIKRSLDLNLAPTHLAGPVDDASCESRSYRSEATITQACEPSTSNRINPKVIDTDSPTLGPAAVSNGLSGLVRAHLRNDSGHSSIYPEDSPRRSRKAEVRESIFGHGSALDHQDFPKGDPDIINGEDRSVPPSLSLTARSILEQATALKNLESGKAKQLLGRDKAQQILGGEAPRSVHEPIAPWQEQPKTSHARGASTETQKEREELAQELAERRRIVQDKLQTFVELDSRPASPTPSARTRDGSPAKSGNAFGLLKKTSRGTLTARQEKPSKALKMLGMDHDSGSSHPPPSSFTMREQIPDRAMPPRSKGSTRPQQQQNVPQGLNEVFSLGLRAKRSQHRQEDGRPQKHSSKSSNGSSAYSEKSDQNSTSRNGNTAKPDLESNHRIGHGPTNNSNASGSQSLDGPPNMYDPSTESFDRSAPSSADRSQSSISGRLRSGSKASAPLEQRPIPPGTPYMINPSTRPTPTSSHSTPSLRQNPSFTSANQPVMISPRHSPTRNFMRSGQHRKQSINKHDISEPSFISCTSSVDTVDLPPGASLKNGMDEPPSPTVAPPIPARDSRRKRTQNLLHALGRQEKAEPTSSRPSPNTSQTNHDDLHEERSTFSDDEPAQKPKRRLRKTSSEGGSMNARAREQAMQAPSPAVPQSPFPQSTTPTINHVQYQAQHDVPASAVMF